jgi:16S rRNA (guanine527-N7)-methyltransferase
MQTQIASVAKHLGLSLNNGQISQLADYLALLHKWNTAYNLSALKTLDDMLVKHLYDCLAVVQPITDVLAPYEAKTILDVGTGAGLPGIVLAVCLPYAQITMLDAVQKKITFVRQAIGTLGLNNAQAHGIRIQDWRQSHSMITARAWTALGDIPTLTGHSLAPNGRIAAMKGPRLAAEAEALPQGWAIETVMDIQVPQLSEARCLAVLKRKTD